MSARSCSVVGCDRPYNAKGYCGMHGQRVRRHGSPEPETLSPRNLPTLARLMAYVEKTSSCWLWHGTMSRKGYGRTSVNGKVCSAHRLMYEVLVGEIPQGLEIDHLCRVRNCVNPDHMEPVDHRTNVLRGDALPAQLARRKKCSKGHPFEEDASGKRRCFVCRPRRLSLDERIAAAVMPPNANGCREWTGEVCGAGYPRVFNGTRRVQAGRLIFEKVNGAIPTGASLVRTCGNRSCVEPSHAQPRFDTRWRPLQRSDAA